MKPVVIVGGGPVGMLLGCLLAQRGVPCEVFERRTTRAPHSRAIGLHGPALAVLDRVGIGPAVRQRAVAIGGGQVFYGSQCLGRLSLEPTSVSLPQSETERLLEERLLSLPCVRFHRGAAVQNLAEYRGRCLVGSDGKDSLVRAQARIPLRGHTYPDHYLMGDFVDTTPFGSDAALFLTRDGIVESFPLPGGQRRWVVWTGIPERPARVSRLVDLIATRTGVVVTAESCAWASAFGVQHQLARRFTQEGLALVGDAAHVISPIGGQGMTLGFLGAETLADAIVAGDLRPYERLQRQRARCIGRRAAFNTAMGRPCAPHSPRLLFIDALLRVPVLAQRFARQFTMADIS